MLIGVPRESRPGETRVAATPKTVEQLIGLGATDAEDDPDPSPICSPAAGEVLPLGTTTVACSVTDSGGRTTSDTFDVTVVDTTAPSIDVAADQAVTTHDPSGATVTYDAASAAELPVRYADTTAGLAVRYAWNCRFVTSQRSR